MKKRRCTQKNTKKKKEHAEAVNSNMKQYPKYKDSGIEWLGEIPEHWKVAPLKYASRIKYGLGQPPKEKEGGLPLIRATNVKHGRISEKDMIYVDPDDIPYNRDPVLKTDDIIVVRSGAYTADSAIIPEKYKGAIAGYDMVVRVSNINPKYLSYSLLSDYVLTNQLFLQRMRAAQPHLNAEELGETLILFPISEEEQNNIGQYLDRKTAKIDNLVSIKKKQIELLKEERIGIINQAVTKGLNPKAKMKDSSNEWQGDVPEHWKIHRIKYLIDLNPSKSFAKNDASRGLVTFLPMEKVNVDGTYDTSEQKTIDDVIQGFTYFIEGDILLAKITPCFENGKGAYISSLPTKYGFGSTEFYVLRPIVDRINPKYLYYFTKSHFFRETGEAFMTGAAGQKRVPSEFIQYFILAIPNTSEQQAIADYLDTQTTKIDKSISDAKKQIDFLKEYRTALISEAVTGKIDVRDSR